jgi:hypothetical protein
MRLGKYYRRFVELIRSPKHRRAATDLDPAERSFRHIWRYVKFTSSVEYPPDRKRPNLLVLQMGKVASLAIQQALNEGGINAFHCHALSPARQQSTIAHLLNSDLTFGLASHGLRLHIHNASLGMLTRWYQKHKQHGGHKLKVVTLTRDPIAYYKSSFVQRRDSVLPKLFEWQRARLGVAADASVDQAKTVQDFVLELAWIIVAAGAENSERCLALAHERWPRHPVVVEEVIYWLRPLKWFDTEIAAIFGLNVLAAPELREHGWVVLQNDWVEVLALQFEELNVLVPKIAEFAGLAALNLGKRNVTEKKPGASQLQAAMDAAIDTATGRACVRALRASAYARACGYDQPVR